MAGKRRREKRRERRRERSRSNGSKASTVPVAQSEKPPPTVEIYLDLPEELRNREERTSVEIAQTLQAATAVPTVPTLPPIEMGTGGSSPWQSLRDLVSWLVKRALCPLRAVFGQDIEEEEAEAKQESEADFEYLELLTQMHDLYDQLFHKGLSETEREVLEGRLEQLQQRRVKLQEARSSKTT